MLITIAGLHGTGKTTVGKLVAATLGLAHHSTGQVFRDMAREHGMSLVEFSEHAAGRDEIDVELDERMKQLGHAGNAVLDGQLCWYFLSDIADHKVFLTCNEAVRIARVHERELKGGGGLLTLEDARHETIERERIEQARYKKIYGVDLSDMTMVLANHDIVVDTTTRTIQDVVAAVLDAIGKAGPPA